jgi:hypothetical protein
MHYLAEHVNNRTFTACGTVRLISGLCNRKARTLGQITTKQYYVHEHIVLDAPRTNRTSYANLGVSCFFCCLMQCTNKAVNATQDDDTNQAENTAWRMVGRLRN